jgi:hypothetical protein
MSDLTDVNWAVVKPCISVRLNISERRRLWDALKKNYPEVCATPYKQVKPWFNDTTRPMISRIFKKALFEKIERGEAL